MEDARSSLMLKQLSISLFISHNSAFFSLFLSRPFFLPVLSGEQISLPSLG